MIFDFIMILLKYHFNYFFFSLTKSSLKWKMRLTFSLLLSLFSVSHYENNKNRKIKLWNNENNKRKRTKLWWQQFVSDFYKFIKVLLETTWQQLNKSFNMKENSISGWKLNLHKDDIKRNWQKLNWSQHEIKENEYLRWNFAQWLNLMQKQPKNKILLSINQSKYFSIKYL